MGILKKLWDMLPEGRPVWVPQPAEWGIKEEIMEKNVDAEVIGIDEVQFFGEKIVEFCKNYGKKWRWKSWKWKNWRKTVGKINRISRKDYGYGIYNKGNNW